MLEHDRDHAGNGIIETHIMIGMVPTSFTAEARLGNNARGKRPALIVSNDFAPVAQP